MKYLITFESYVNANGELELSEDIFDEFPEDILNTLNNNYYYLFSTNFDWNKETKRFSSPEGGYDSIKFNKWIETHKQTEFIKNLDKIITKIREDLLTIKREELARRKLETFEELIKPVFGKNITSDALTKYEQNVLLNPYATLEQIEKGFEEAKNIIDKQGNIDSSKIEKSTIFVGGEVNLPKFEDFIKIKPEYKKTFDIWKKLLYDHTNYMVKQKNAHNIVSYEKLRNLYDFLIGYRKNNN